MINIRHITILLVLSALGFTSAELAAEGVYRSPFAPSPTPAPPPPMIPPKPIFPILAPAAPAGQDPDFYKCRMFGKDSAGNEITEVNGNYDPPRRCSGFVVGVQPKTHCGCKDIGYNQPGYWPPDHGCKGAETTTTLNFPMVICRFGNPDGRFVFPSNGNQGFDDNSLPNGSLGAFNCWELNCAESVKTCVIAPWFGRKGGGTQYRFEYGIASHECLRPLDPQEVRKRRLQ